MPRLSIDRELARLRDEARDDRRFVDCSVHVRRLGIAGRELERGAVLCDPSGGRWVVGEQDPLTGWQPVSSAIVGYSRSWQPGAELARGSECVELVEQRIITGGGVWDTLHDGWKLDGDGNRAAGAGAMIIDAQESQIEAFTWIAERIAAMRAGQPHPQVAGLLFDDRRGGKTFSAAAGGAIAALDMPRAADGSETEVRVATQTVPARDEIDAVYKFMGLGRFGRFTEQPKRMWRLISGAKIRFLTTDNEDTLLEGRADVVVLNEAALYSRNVYETLVRATQDRRGFLLITTNKPKRAKGNWVTLMWQGAARDEKDGNIPAVARLRVDPKQNAAIDQAAKGPIARSIMYARGDESEEIDEGLIAEAGAKLFAPPFVEEEHYRPLPEVGMVDMTGDFTYVATGRRFDLLVGQDYQYQCAASAWKLLAPGGDLDRLQMWCVWARWLHDEGDEDDILDEMESDGLTSDRCLIIPDSTGGSQGGQHKHGKEPPSHQVLRRRGFAFQTPQEKKNPKSMHATNPRVAISTMRARKWIADGKVFVARIPEAAKMARALLRCDGKPNKYGDILAYGPWAHLIDTFRYPHWWVGRWMPRVLQLGGNRAAG